MLQDMLEEWKFTKMQVIFVVEDCLSSNCSAPLVAIRPSYPTLRLDGVEDSVVVAFSSLPYLCHKNGLSNVSYSKVVKCVILLLRWHRDYRTRSGA